MDYYNGHEDFLDRIEKLNAIGIALSSQRNAPALLEMILQGAKSILNADGGTLYLASEDKQHLIFEIIINDSLEIMMGGTTGVSIPFDPLPLYDREGKPNNNMVAAYAAINHKTINIPDAYVAEGFDFSGTRAFDRKTGYRSQSFITVPMQNHESELIGVLQLINAKDPRTGAIIPFSEQSRSLAESLASQAAIALSNNRLIQEFRQLFESFIELMAEAIDVKSPYNGKHCRRVPDLTMMIAEAVCKANYGIFKDFSMTEEELYELKIAGLLHDCGKVTTPVHVIDKATKLQTIFDRIHLIDTRFEVLKRDAEIEFLNQKLAALESGNPQNVPSLEAKFQQKIQQLNSDRTFLQKCNIGGEFMRDDLKERVLQIAKYEWVDTEGKLSPFLNENEVYNLNISRGTLTPEERQIINDHIVVTINMLTKLPYPKNLRRVPEYAGGHHERMDGKGYPKGLTREQMSVPARMMGIADIFEALSSDDRPYKDAKTLTECLQILGKMKQENHIDPDLFDLFVNEKVYLRYAEKYLHEYQIDQVDLTKIPGYTPPAV
ncbi:HD domain-containing phosphohydrolase [Tumidithrix elongata RA019]|uniref:HD domain-containing phosphohydrolase n=1 Tax=Tumidithrix elongata BACA0141 TaxID=2716417 RepID=A0AAW9PVH8_9CYAN|nr:HD domain-containing phosphohydrolase [Tumidithrix elongata RA019]